MHQGASKKIQTGEHKAMERSFMKASRILLIFPALVFVYIILYHSFYIELYPLSTVDPYLYYGYSPGFWAVDISFWIFSPLMYLTFRKNYEGSILSIIYTLCMDASAVGAFLVFFSLVYGLDIFASHYYTYGFVLMLLFVLPIEHIKANKKLLLYFLVFPVMGIVWRISGPGNIGYFLSPSVVIDLIMIVYCFFFEALLVGALSAGGKKAWTATSH